MRFFGTLRITPCARGWGSEPPTRIWDGGRVTRGLAIICVYSRRERKKGRGGSERHASEIRSRNSMAFSDPERLVRVTLRGPYGRRTRQSMKVVDSEGIRPASIKSLYRRRSIAQITRRVERCDLKAIPSWRTIMDKVLLAIALISTLSTPAKAALSKSQGDSTRGTSSRSTNIKNDGIKR